MKHFISQDFLEDRSSRRIVPHDFAIDGEAARRRLFGDMQKREQSIIRFAVDTQVVEAVPAGQRRRVEEAARARRARAQQRGASTTKKIRVVQLVDGMREIQTTQQRIGCQFRGDASRQPQLIGYATLNGDIRLIELPPEALGGLRNYVGGLAISADGETVAASSPVGGAILCINAATARPVSTTLLGSTCGVAADAQGFLASNGLGQLIGLGGSRAQERQFDFQFDEHLRRLMV